MKWVTRERARVDRVACPWLIAHFIDPQPQFLFVPVATVLEVAQREHAIPYDIPNVELGHHGPQCSSDAFIERFELDDPALSKLAPIVRGADTEGRDVTPNRRDSTRRRRAFRPTAAMTSTIWSASFRCATRIARSAAPRHRRRKQSPVRAACGSI